MKYIVKPAATLFITAVITIAMLSAVYTFTLEPIEEQKRKTRETVMNAVLPQASGFALDETREYAGNIVAIYEGRLPVDGENVLVGYVVQLSPTGYSGNIDLMVGISAAEERITGMRVLRHTETPGLGALAVKEDFYRRYDNRELIPLRVVRSSPGEHEINAITSATITTRAITDAVNEAIEWYKKGGGR